jgi:hypothetical protein
MIGGYGICGRELCCASFLSEFEPISIRMAKDQDLPLSPGKVSGVCGRLMCCLGYEARVYEEFKRGLPKLGERVRVREGAGRVRKHNLFADAFTVELEGGEQVQVSKRDWHRGFQPEEGASAPAPQAAAPAGAPAGGRGPGGRPQQRHGGGERAEHAGRGGRGGRRGRGGRGPDRGGGGAGSAPGAGPDEDPGGAPPPAAAQP